MATPYAVEWTDDAIESRKALTLERQVLALDIVQQLSRESADATDTPVDGDVFPTYRDPATMLAITYACDVARRVLRIVHVAEPQVPVPPRVFISYSHTDKRWLARLRTFLDLLEQQQLVRIWDDSDIKPGMEWLAEIQKALGSARVVVFLVTPDFLVSTFITRKEVPGALERARAGGCDIFWIAVSHSPVDDTPLARYQAVNDPKHPLDTLPKSKQNLVFVRIYERVKEAVRPPA